MSVSDYLGCVNQIEFHGRSFAGEDISNYKIVQPGDIIYTKSPLHLKPYGIIKIVKNISGIVSPLYIVNKTINNTDPLFIYYMFDTPERTNNYLKPLVRKGAKNTMNISNNEWLSGYIYIPLNKSEQQKISKFFSIIDKKIEQQENLLTLLNKYKRGLFYHVFLKYDKYKQTKIADLICKYETDVNCKNYLEISDIDIKTNTYKIDINKLAVNGSKKGYQGNIIISTVRPNRGAITILKDNIYISSGFCQLHINNDIANTNFIYQVIKSKKFLNKMQLLTTGTTYPTISQNDILNISIPVPSLEEQNKIANILSTYDNLIDKEKQVLNLLQEMKSGLLQQMFI